MARPPVSAGALQFKVKLEPFTVTVGAVLPAVVMPLAA